MQKTIKCGICGQKFTTRKPNKKYCCYECRVKAIQKNRKAWSDRNKDYMKRYMKDYRKKKEEKTEHERR